MKTWKFTKNVVQAYQKHYYNESDKPNEKSSENSSQTSEQKTDESSGDQALVKKRSRFGNKKSDEVVKPKKKSRFASEDDDDLGVGNGQLISKGSSELRNLHQQKTFLLRLKIDDLNRKLDHVVEDARDAAQDPNRSPSPAPIYDREGRKINVREFRMRQKIQNERQVYMEELIKLNPALKPKNMQFSLFSKKLYVPVDDYPGYNFLGLIIGPRGLTQKRMEKETNTRITIRGKGSAKPGLGKVEEDPHDNLYVLIQGEDEDEVEMAAEMVEKLLVPNHECLEEHRMKQMQELAIINGTTKDDDVCINCGEKGHKIYECPNKTVVNFTVNNIVCKICGERSHPTADCPQKNLSAEERREQGDAQRKVDSDFNEFLEMLGEKKSSEYPNVNNNTQPSLLQQGEYNAATPPTGQYQSEQVQTVKLVDYTNVQNSSGVYNNSGYYPNNYNTTGYYNNGVYEQGNYPVYNAVQQPYNYSQPQYSNAYQYPYNYGYHPMPPIMQPPTFPPPATKTYTYVPKSKQQENPQ